jgi:DNA-binding NarL/FixJ family response regulator
MTAIVIYAPDTATRERLAALAAKIEGAEVIGTADTPEAVAKLLSESVDALVLTETPVDRAPSEPLLTPRELEVLTAMADGASNKAIARRLGISFHTVKFHVAAILEKLDAESRTEAVAAAARLGLIML